MVTKLVLVFRDTYARSSPRYVLYDTMGNCLSIKMDTKRRVWVRRRRRQRSNQLQLQSFYPSHGTIYSDALPRPRKDRHHRSRQSNHLVLNYVPVASSGQPMPWLSSNNTTQQHGQHPSQPTAPTQPTQPMSTQAVPAQQNVTQSSPTQLVMPQQHAMVMDVAMARDLLQDP